MMTPQQPHGQQEGSRIDVLMATKMLERALPSFGVQSPEGKAILTALKGLAKAFGESEQNTQELMPAELRHMMAAAAGPGTPGGPPPQAATPPPPAQGA